MRKTNNSYPLKFTNAPQEPDQVESEIGNRALIIQGFSSVSQKSLFPALQVKKVLHVSSFHGTAHGPCLDSW